MTSISESRYQMQWFKLTFMKKLRVSQDDCIVFIKITLCSTLLSDEIMILRINLILYV